MIHFYTVCGVLAGLIRVSCSRRRVPANPRESLPCTVTVTAPKPIISYTATSSWRVLLHLHYNSVSTGYCLSHACDAELVPRSVVPGTRA